MVMMKKPNTAGVVAVDRDSARLLQHQRMKRRRVIAIGVGMERRISKMMSRAKMIDSGIRIVVDRMLDLAECQLVMIPRREVDADVRRISRRGWGGRMRIWDGVSQGVRRGGCRNLRAVEGSLWGGVGRVVGCLSVLVVREVRGLGVRNLRVDGEEGRD